MKRLFAVLVAAMLVVGVAGQAAALEFSTLYLAAVENPDSDSGNEFIFDLGQGLDTSTALDATSTGITLDSFNTNDWSDIYISVFDMGAYTNDNTMTFASVVEPEAMSTAAYTGYWSTTITTMYNSTTEGADAKSDTDSFWYIMDKQGNATGSYNYMVDAPGTEYTALQLAADSVLTIDLYEFDVTADALAVVGTYTLDTTSGTLMVSYAPVPVPAAVWLLGSGLLGLIGIRRRNA